MVAQIQKNLFTVPCSIKIHFLLDCVLTCLYFIIKPYRLLRDIKKTKKNLKTNATRPKTVEESESEPVKKLPENNQERTINIHVHDIQLRQFRVRFLFQ